MFYEFRIIGGRVMVRTDPRGEWQASNGPLAKIINAMLDLTDDADRLTVLGLFCRGCGCIQPEGRGCQCQNDD